jgi:hypothetical protein
MGSLLTKIVTSLIPGRAIYKSLTVWGLAVYFGAEHFVDRGCDEGLISFESCQWWLNFLESFGITLGALGLRRAAMKGASK